MKLTALLECVSFAAAVHAATVKVPIISVARDVSDSLSKERMAAMIEAGMRKARKQNQNSERTQRRHRQERPMRSGPVGGVENDEKYMDYIKESSMMKVAESESQNPRRPLPLWHWNELTYTTTLSIGTPPQTLNVLLSISDSDLFIPSSTCRDDCGTHNFNSTNSSTHTCEAGFFYAFPSRFYCSGILSQDSLRLSTLEIKNQIFGEVDEMRRYMPHWGDSSWDGLLGLSPSNENSDLGILNPFQNMLSQNLLDRNLFSLKLPRGADDKGEILFGDIDHDLYIGELKSLPLLPYDENHAEEVSGRWAVSATKLSIGEDSIDLSGGVAVFETDFPFIGLPENYVMLLDKYLGMDNAGKSWDHLRSIDCRGRKMLENITITLGKEDFVISPWEYTIEVEMKDMGGGGKRCVSAFLPKEGYGDENYVVLGSAFLRAFYGVFDSDRRTVSLARATSQKIRHSKGDAGEELK